MDREGEAYLRERRSLAEHPFGTLKRWSGWDHFLVRGRRAVNGELSLMVLCYHFRRVLTILGIDGFRRYLEARRQAVQNAGKKGLDRAGQGWQRRFPPMRAWRFERALPSPLGPIAA